jgi:uncharacterized protein (TIGR02452 family)
LDLVGELQQLSIAMDRSSDNINLFPGKRKKETQTPSMSQSQKDHLGQTATSPFFERSKSSDKPKLADRNHHDTEASGKSKGRGDRQMLLSAQHGSLTTKNRLINPTPRSSTQREALRRDANETTSLLPGLLATRPDVGTDGHLITSTQPLDPTMTPCPNSKQTCIQVIDADCLDVALSLLPSKSTADPPPLILNMANANHAGGGFKNGALAQEESLCYRTSLSFTLKIRHYPIPEKGAIYSPRVLVIRESLQSSTPHALRDLRDPSKLPVVSVVSSAALCLPHLTHSTDGNGQTLSTYTRSSDRSLMRDKMRTILRTAASNEHRTLVLGAFGCGAFRNPPKEVARLWREVLVDEREFHG